MLEELTWQEAEQALRPDSLVVIPIGAAAKEHGPHLQLKNDWLMVEYFKRQILEGANTVVVAPTVNYHYYPAFLEYPGSTSLRLETARDLLVDICRSLSRYGPRKFYALNTGISTIQPLAQTAEILAREKIAFRYCEFRQLTEDVAAKMKEEDGGTHAGEIETSMMLFIAPETVDMTKAVRDYNPSAEGGLTRDPHGVGSYSASGIYGDPTLATRKKGELLVEAVTRGILKEIQNFQEMLARS